MKTLSILIPAYNEEKSLRALLERVQGVNTKQIGYRKEIVVVDDGSTDNTYASVQDFPGIKLVRQSNQGKGAAVQRAVAECTGEYCLVQDADLEYAPEDYIPLLSMLSMHPDAAIYGSRTMGVYQSGEQGLLPGKNKGQSLGPWFAGVCLTIWTFLIFGKFLTDTLTGYKIYRTDVLRSLTVRTRGFETDHELTCKLLKKGIEIFEVPISYQPRSYSEGKKIRWTDGFRALYTILKFRFVN